MPNLKWLHNGRPQWTGRSLMTGDTSTGANAEGVARSPMWRIVGADRSAEFPLSARVFRTDEAGQIGLLADRDAVLN